MLTEFHGIPLWIWSAVGLAGLILLVTLVLWSRRKSKVKVGAPWTLGLQKTRQNFLGKLSGLMSIGGKVDSQLLSQLEELLLSADVGVATTQRLLEGVERDFQSSGKNDAALLQEYLGEEIYKILHHPSQDLNPPQSPHVMMMVGVNGVGKTTSIAKLAHHYIKEGNKVLLAAADTFRAGAVNQLQIWGERVGATTLAQGEGSDPAAVAFDAVKAGLARKMDRVIIDTAGRLHTKVNLMEELKKVKRVIEKAMPGAPHEIWLVVDATQGQNALRQAREFHQSLGLTGVILSKLDSSSKGGIAVGIAGELQVPLVYAGVGEKMEDLRPFEARAFVDALLS